VVFPPPTRTAPIIKEQRVSSSTVKIVIAMRSEDVEAFAEAEKSGCTRIVDHITEREFPYAVIRINGELFSYD
jgi:hypothetical protein